MKKWVSGIGLAAGLVLAGTQGWAVECLTVESVCGDTAGPDGTDIPCECGDKVVTNTKLTGSDPVVSKNPDDICHGTALCIGADDITLDCKDLVLRGPGYGYNAGVDLYDHSGVTIKKCKIQGFTVGIDAGSGFGAASANSMLSNQLTNNGTGIEVSHSTANTVNNNDASGNEGDGIAFDNVTASTFDNNKTLNNGEDGIHGYVSSNNVISNNRSEGNSYNGLFLEYSSINAVTGNQLNDNDDGLDVEGSNNVISGNRTSENYEDGIDVEGDNNVLDSNNGNNNGENGIEVETGSGNVVLKNTFNKNGEHGICVVSGNVNAGGNKGSNNGVPPDVDFNCSPI